MKFILEINTPKQAESTPWPVEVVLLLLREQADKLSHNAEPDMKWNDTLTWKGQVVGRAQFVPEEPATATMFKIVVVDISASEEHCIGYADNLEAGEAIFREVVEELEEDGFKVKDLGDSRYEDSDNYTTLKASGEYGVNHVYLLKVIVCK